MKAAFPVATTGKPDQAAAISVIPDLPHDTPLPVAPDHADASSRKGENGEQTMPRRMQAGTAATTLQKEGY